MRHSLLAVLLLAGCHPKVVGTYNGPLRQTPPGDGNATTDFVDVVIAEAGDGTFLVKVEDCSFTAKVTSSNEAFVDMQPDPFKCPCPRMKGTTFSVDPAKADMASMQVERSGTLTWTFRGTSHGTQGDGIFYSEFTGGKK